MVQKSWDFYLFICPVIRRRLYSLPHSCGFNAQWSLLNTSPDLDKKGLEERVSGLPPRKKSVFPFFPV